MFIHLSSSSSLEGERNERMGRLQALLSWDHPLSSMKSTFTIKREWCMNDQLKGWLNEQSSGWEFLGSKLYKNEWPFNFYIHNLKMKAKPLETIQNLAQHRL